MKTLATTAVCILWTVQLLAQSDDMYIVRRLNLDDNPVYSARIYYKDSLIAVHNAETDERIYLDVEYADDGQNYEAGGILFSEFGGRRNTLLEIKNCADSSPLEISQVQQCVELVFLKNFQELAEVKRKNILTYIMRNI